MGRVEDHRPTIFMLLLQVLYAGITLGTRSSLLQGMNPRIFVVYRQCIATLLIAPIACFARLARDRNFGVKTLRNSSRCRLGWKNFGMIFLLSLVGVSLNQTIYFEGLYMASSSVASAMGNLVPATTFILAYFVGLEKVNIRSLRSIAKIMGTLICVTGAIGIILLKGPKLLNKEFLPLHNSLFSKGGETNWLLGCLLLFGSNLSWSIWLILQVPVSASYPDHLSLTAWMCFLGALQSATANFFIESDLEGWKLHSYQEFGCCFYAAAGSAISFFTQSWCVSKRGPLFSAMFSPLVTVIVTIFAIMLLHEEMYTGSLIGAFAVIFGLYIVLWGKTEDHEKGMKPRCNDKHTTPTIDESSDVSSCKIDLEEPLLCSKLQDAKDDH